MSFVRLVTIHPILVHATIGAIPLLVVTYWIAAVRRSERWTFAADVVLAVTAVLTIFTAGFGLISFFAVDWPGGLQPWSALHLAFGAVTTAGLLAFAGYRWARRRRSQVSGRPALYAALGVAAVAGFTGWIGGEVLVYRSGVAVEAAGGGALAPTLGEPTNTQPVRPAGIMDAMAQLRGSWAAVTTDVARMVVEEPTDARFDRIARHTEHMRRLAHWLAENPGPGPHGDDHDHQHGPGVSQGAGGPAQASASLRADSALMVASLEASATDLTGAVDLTAARSPSDAGNSRRATIVAGARALEEQVRQVERAAWDRNLGEVARTLGQVTSTCAHCHQESRWSEHDVHEQEPRTSPQTREQASARSTHDDNARRAP